MSTMQLATFDEAQYDALSLLLDADVVGSSLEDGSNSPAVDWLTSDDTEDALDSPFGTLVSSEVWDGIGDQEFGFVVAASDEEPGADAFPSTPLTDADFAGVELSVVLEHALGLKAILDEAGVGLDTQDPMYADYAAEYQAVAAYLALAGISTADKDAYAEDGDAAPLTATDFAAVELSVVVEHALGLKAVLDDAGASLDTQDPMYAGYAAEYRAAVTYLASADIIL